VDVAELTCRVSKGPPRFAGVVSVSDSHLSGRKSEKVHKSDSGGFFTLVNLAHPDELDPRNQQSPQHKCGDLVNVHPSPPTIEPYGTLPRDASIAPTERVASAREIVRSAGKPTTSCIISRMQWVARIHAKASSVQLWPFK
jgi:hypothetical protein